MLKLAVRLNVSPVGLARERRVAATLDLLWALGAAGAATFVLYGGGVSVAYRWRATTRLADALARLAMHDCIPVGESVDELRSLANEEWS